MNIIDKFLEYLKANEKSENTIKNYQSDLNSFGKLLPLGIPMLLLNSMETAA